MMLWAGSAADGDAPGLFAQLDHAVGVLLRGREVEVAELGDGMAECVVDGAEGELAAVEVGELGIALEGDSSLAFIGYPTPMGRGRRRAFRSDRRARARFFECSDLAFVTVRSAV